MPTPTHRWLIAILLLSVLLRVGVALYLGDSVPSGKDEQSYSELAWRLATGHGYSFDRAWYPFAPANAPTAHWSFLYTAFVAAVYAVAGQHPLVARLAQAVLAGLLLPWLTYRLAQRVTGDRGQASGDRGQASGVREQGAGDRKQRASYIVHRTSNIPHSTFDIPTLAAFLSAIYAYFVLYGAMVQTEALYICALLWSLERALALTPGPSPNRGRGEATSPQDWGGRGATLGLSLGVATLLRQSILPWVVVLFAWLIYTGWRARCLRPALVALSASALTLALCIAPFTIRNTLAYGSFLLLNSNAGYAMYSAQHPDHGTSFREYWAAPLPNDIDPAVMNEATWDKELMRRGVGFVLADPWRYVMLSLSRVRDYIEFWPTADSSPLFNAGRVASIGVFLPFMLYGVWLAVRRGQESGGRDQETDNIAHRTSYIRHSTFDIQHSTFLLLFVLFYSALHIATWAMSRYRLPVDAVLLIFAGLAIGQLAERWRSR